MSLNKTAQQFTPKWAAATPPTGPTNAKLEPISLGGSADILKPRTRRQYTRDQLKSVHRRMRDARGHRISEWMLHNWLKLHQDLVDPDHIASAAKREIFPESCSLCLGRLRLKPNAASATNRHEPLVEDETFAAPPCDAIASIIESVVAEERAKHGAFLLQDPQVVLGQIELQLIFDSPSTTRRMRALRTSAPNAYSAIKTFLCGPGFHVAPPKADKHEAWTALLQRLRFDAIRDNLTPVYTELSKHWKKRHSPFEQFAHFLSYRDSLPPVLTYNMITHAQKPILVAAAMGDTTAFVLLAKLGFAMPGDMQLQTGFLKDLLDTRRYAVLRHLNQYFYRRQFKNPAPIVRQSIAPPPAVSVSLGASPATGPAPDPALGSALDHLPFHLPANHPALRVWEPRPPKKSGSAAAGAGASGTTPPHRLTGGSNRSPMDDPSFSASLPGCGTQAPAADSPGGATNTLNKQSSWAAKARAPATPAASATSTRSATSPQHAPADSAAAARRGSTPAIAASSSPSAVPKESPEKPAQQPAASATRPPAAATATTAPSTTEKPPQQQQQAAKGNSNRSTAATAAVPAAPSTAAAAKKTPSAGPKPAPTAVPAAASLLSAAPTLPTSTAATSAAAGQQPPAADAGGAKKPNAWGTKR